MSTAIIGNRVKEMRLARGETMQGLSRRAGCSPASLVAIERYNHIPGRELRRRLAAALEIEETELWGVQYRSAGDTLE